MSTSLNGPAPAHRRTLHDGWTVSAVDRPAITDVPAIVPGLVHLDLIRAGLIEDPFDGDNESVLQWIGRTAWRYAMEFQWHPDGNSRHDLVADGLDTVAVLELNGREIGRAQNQHRGHRFDVRSALVAGTNRLVVTFAAPVTEAERRSAEHGQLPHVNHHPYNALRKSASNFGWDWGIDVASSGIWRPIALESWTGARIATTRLSVAVDSVTTPVQGSLTVAVVIERDGESEPAAVEAIVTLDQLSQVVTVPAGRSSATAVIVKQDAALWWPRGHGDQPLSTVTVALTTDPEGPSTWRGRVGFRTVTLNTEPDADGAPFEVIINDRVIQVRGVNWIPDHAFITEVDRARCARRIDDAIQANVNLIRVWGGGFYESEDFYELCDENGVLVWQDFLFACAAYAEEGWLANEVEAEAREQIARLSSHASLAIWNGNNENIWLRMQLGWRPQLAGKTWGNGYYKDLLPRLIAELDPSRPYSPSTPFSFDDYLHPNDPANGTMHVWDVWNEIDYSHYRDHRARFVAEFGFQGPPAWSTLVGAVHDTPLEPSAPQMLTHQKADDGNAKLERGLRDHLPAPRDIHEWHWATQLNQAHAVRFGIEHYRSLTPLNAGMIVWQLNDNWPVISWSAVDFKGQRKPVWHAIRAAYAPRLATVQPRGDGLVLILLNDTDDAWAGVARIRRVDLAGRQLHEQQSSISVGAWGATTATIGADLVENNDPTTELLVVEFDSGSSFERSIWNFAEVKDQNLAASAFTAAAEEVEGGYRVQVLSTAYVRDLFVQADRVDPLARVDQGLVSLLPGEVVEFHINSSAEVDPDLFIDPLVLRAANGLSI